MQNKITAKTTKNLLSSSKELAFVDIREIGQHSKGHPFFSVSIPFSVFEIKIQELIPNKNIDIILFDENDDLSEKAHEIAMSMGYKKIFILEDGVHGWTDEGYELFDGINVPSKAFGEWVEIKKQTPHIKPYLLSKKIQKKQNIIIVDGRPLEEFKRMNIPNAICCPNMEIPINISEFIDKKTEIIINCAGRTRSIIGAQNLINYGIKNSVKALENGTQGWFLANLELEKNQTRQFKDQKVFKKNETISNKASQLIKKYGLKKVSLKQINIFFSDKTRTTYIFDITTHSKNSRCNDLNIKNVPGGQLIQATDNFIGVQNSRIILVDEGDLIRSSMTASWLKQMGYEVYVFEDDLDYINYFFEKKSKFVIPKHQIISISEIKSYLSFNILDTRNSHDYKKLHFKRSKWISRKNLRFTNFREKRNFLIIFDDLNKAELISKDISSKYNGEIFFYEFKENEVIQFSDFLTKSSSSPKKSECIDFVYHTYKRHSGNKNHAKSYLKWEKELLQRMDEQEKRKFKVF